MIAGSVVVCLALISLSVATEVHQCDGQKFEGLQSNVELLKCEKPPCKLKKGKTQEVSIAFTPTRDSADIKNSVAAIIASFPFPFIGVDGVSICDKIYSESGEKASCPVKANTKYVYKDSFPILAFYPTVNPIVQWGLKDDKDKMVTCFKVPARIF